jgi:hypothetical protein
VKTLQLAAIVLLLAGATEANAQVCATTSARGLSAQLNGGGGDGFNDLGTRVAYGFGRMQLTADYASRSFSEPDGSAHRWGGAVAVRTNVKRLELCPSLGVTSESIDVLTTWQVPLVLAAALPIRLGANSQLIPFVEPALVYTAAQFSDIDLTSVDPAVTAGVGIGFGRAVVGAAWVEQSRERAPSSWRVFLGYRMR